MEIDDDARADIAGLVQLLCLAEASLRPIDFKGLCLRLVSSSIAELRKRHNIQNSDSFAGTTWAEPGAAPVARLLFYAAGEARALGEHGSATALTLCAEGLMDAHDLTESRIFGIKSKQQGYHP